jgi:hypothetical protein
MLARKLPCQSLDCGLHHITLSIRLLMAANLPQFAVCSVVISLKLRTGSDTPASLPQSRSSSQSAQSAVVSSQEPRSSAGSWQCSSSQCHWQHRSTAQQPRCAAEHDRHRGECEGGGEGGLCACFMLHLFTKQLLSNNLDSEMCRGHMALSEMCWARHMFFIYMIYLPCHSLHTQHLTSQMNHADLVDRMHNFSISINQAAHMRAAAGCGCSRWRAKLLTFVSYIACYSYELRATMMGNGSR